METPVSTTDPIELAKVLWPDVVLSEVQVEQMRKRWDEYTSIGVQNWNHSMCMRKDVQPDIVVKVNDETC